MELNNQVIKTSNLRKLELLERLESQIVAGFTNTNDAIAGIANALATINTGVDNGLVINSQGTEPITVTYCNFQGLETGLRIQSRDVNLAGTTQFNGTKTGIHADNGMCTAGESFYDEDYDEDYDNEDDEEDCMGENSPEATQASKE